MLNSLKDFIKTKPIIYDYVISMLPIQGDEDVWLDKFSRGNNRIVSFIQVGANDGLRWDPLRRFILRDNWNGVLIEPIPPVYKLLKQNYFYAKRNNLFFENCAITNGDSVNFWSYSEDFLNSLTLEDRLYYLRKSSIDKKQVEKSLIGVSESDKHIECYKTPCMTLNDVIEKYFPDYKLDLVFIDAEGRDDDVIRTIDFEKCTPNAIFYESHNLGSRNKEIKSYLSSKGYTITQLKGDAVAEIKS